MKKTDKKKQQLLMHLSIVPIASGKQLELFFKDYQQPEKRLSDCLRELKEDGLVEGKLRPIGESKIWRLTKKGREWMDVKKHPVPLTNRNIDHFLSIASVYFSLQMSSSLTFFEVEPRFQFYTKEGDSRLYCPDGFFVWEDKCYFLEVQLSPLTKKSWRYKWEVAEGFFDSSLPFSYQGFNLSSQAPIVVISEQTTNAIQQTQLELLISPEIEELFPIEKERKQTVNANQIIEHLKSDIQLSQSIYSNWNNERGASKIPPFSIEALKKYEILLKQ